MQEDPGASIIGSNGIDGGTGFNVIISPDGTFVTNLRICLSKVDVNRTNFWRIELRGFDRNEYSFFNLNGLAVQGIGPIRGDAPMEIFFTVSQTPWNVNLLQASNIIPIPLQTATMLRVDGTNAQTGPADEELFGAPVLDRRAEVNGIESGKSFPWNKLHLQREQCQ